MGLRNSNNIKLLRHGSSGTRKVNSAVIIPVMPVASAPVIFADGPVVFDREILAQPLGKTGMINRIYEKHYPSFNKRTPFARKLDELVDVPQLWYASGAHAEYLPEETRLGDVDFANLYGEVEKIIDTYWNEAKFTPETTPSGRSLTGTLGKYKFKLSQWGDDDVRLELWKDKSNIARLEYAKKFPFMLHMENGPFKSAVDAKVMELLGWSLVEDTNMFRALLDLMK